MISIGTAPGTELHPNEDWVGATSDVIVVLDGLSAPQGVGGCRHGTPWYVTRLGTRLLMHATEQARLRDALAISIADVAALHGSACDLQHPGTPSSTVAMARRHGGELEALVLADSSVLVETDSGVDVMTDTRVGDIARGAQEAALSAPLGVARDQRIAELVSEQRRWRNTPNGYWIAQSDPVAADQALTQKWTIDRVSRVAVMTDGASRLADTYEMRSWSTLLDLLSEQGPAGVIDETRKFESDDPDGTRWPRYKSRDDIAIAFWDFRSPQQSAAGEARVDRYN